MDLTTDLPVADGFDSILVVVDQGLLKRKFSSLATRLLLLKTQPDYYWNIYTNDLASQTKSSQIEDPSLLQKNSSNC
jgi:hypothetical protein